MASLNGTYTTVGAATYFDGSSTSHNGGLFSEGYTATNPTQTLSLEDLLNDDSFAIDNTQCNSPSSNWFLILKNKIINTDKLIQRYQAKNRKVKELQTSLIGFKNDLKMLQQKYNKCKSTIAKLKEDMEKKRNLEAQQKKYIEQLEARCDELEQCKVEAESAQVLKKDKKELARERNQLRKENRKLEKKLQNFLKEVPTVCTGHISVNNNDRQETKKSTNEKQRTKQLLMHNLQEELDKLGSVIAAADEEDSDEFEEVSVQESNNGSVATPTTIQDMSDVIVTNDNGLTSIGELQHKRVRTDSDSSTNNDLVKRVCPDEDEFFDDFNHMDDYNCDYHSDQHYGDTVIPELDNESADVEYDHMIDTMLGHAHLDQHVLTPIPPTPPLSPLPSFDFPCLPPLTPLPASPIQRVLTHTLSPLPPSPVSMTTTTSLELCNSEELEDNTLSHDYTSHDNLIESTEDNTLSHDRLTDAKDIDFIEPVKEQNSSTSKTSHDYMSHDLAEPQSIISSPRVLSQDINECESTQSPVVSHDLTEPQLMEEHQSPMMSHDLMELSHDQLGPPSIDQSTVNELPIPLSPTPLCISDISTVQKTVTESMLMSPTHQSPSSSPAQQSLPSSPTQRSISSSPAPLCIMATDTSVTDDTTIHLDKDAVPFSTFLEATPTNTEAMPTETTLTIIETTPINVNNTEIVGYANVSIKDPPIEMADTLSDGEISEDDGQVGYGNLDVTMPTIDQNVEVTVDLSTDGATGQWVNELTTPTGSCSPSNSSCSSTPVLAQEFPTVGSQVKPSVTNESQSVSGGDTTVKLCQSQQSLNDYYQCPKPLPPWLADVLLQNQDKVHLQDKKPMKGKKGKNNCTLKCLQLTLQGTLPLSECISTLSNTVNTPTVGSLWSGLIKYISTQYFPPFESVVQLCWNRCSAIVAKSLDPFNPNYVPPLPMEEAIMIALIVNIQQCHSDLPMLIPELLQKFRECVLSDTYGFHCRCICSRLYSCLCRLVSDIDQAQFIVCDIFLQSMSTRILPLAVTAISMWPKAFSRNTSGPPLFIKDSINTKGLEYQPLSFTLEMIMSFIAQTQNDQNLHKGPLSNARILCKWELVPLKTIQSLVNSFIDILKLSPYIKIETPPTTSGTGYSRSTPKPRPSKHAYAIVTALRLLATSQGWSWTNDTLIRQHLWPILQSWNKQPNSVKPETVICVIRLLGFIGKMGLTSDPNSASIKQLVKVFSMILQKFPSTTNSSDKDMTLPIQLSAADALLDLHHYCTPDNVTVINTAIRTWTTQLFRDKTTTSYGIEYSNVLLQPTTTNNNNNNTTTSKNSNIKKKGKRSQRNTRRSLQRKAAKGAAIPPPPS